MHDHPTYGHRKREFELIEGKFSKHDFIVTVDQTCGDLFDFYVEF